MNQLMRKVWRTPRAGTLGALTLQDEPLTPLEPGKVRIETKAAGLNFADIFALTGLYSATPQGSFIPGLEFSGVVVDSGVHEKKFAAGDPVMGVTRFGGYASIVDVATTYCIPLPQDWTYSQGAAYPAQTLTAWYALKVLGDVKPNHTVLIQSAAGGVGLRTLQICKRLGVRAIGTVSTQTKKDFLKEMGYAETIVRDRHFTSNVRTLLAGQELNLVLETIGGALLKECYELLAPTGRLVVFGAAEFTPGKNRPHYLRALRQYLMRPKIDPLKLISENKSVMGFNLIWLWEKLDLLVPMLAELEALHIDPPHVGKEFAFSEAPAALEHLRSGKSIGKVVLNA
jgi:alcohol dehydrogenase